jgi:hypothetical protein
MIAAAAFALLMAAQNTPSAAPTQKTFSSPHEAAHALYEAVRKQDAQELEAVLGAGPDVTSTGDESVDALNREQFVRKYEEMCRLVRELDGTTVLYIGAENWPFPIPLTSRGGRWAFDAKAGAEEILYRQIGSNEAVAFEICQQFLGGEQPAGDEPIHGYRFRVLASHPKAVGTTGSSGRKRPIEVAFVAYPIDYRATGVMTFIVTAEGTVYEKDLGPDTAKFARAIGEHVSTSGWNLVK